MNLYIHYHRSFSFLTIKILSHHVILLVVFPLICKGKSIFKLPKMSQNFENLCDADRNNNSSITVVEVDKPTSFLNTQSDSKNDSIIIRYNNSDTEDTNKLKNNNSKNLSIWRKRLILLIVSIAAAISPMTDAILYPALIQICSDFQAPEIFVIY